MLVNQTASAEEKESHALLVLKQSDDKIDALQCKLTTTNKEIADMSAEVILTSCLTLILNFLIQPFSNR